MTTIRTLALTTGCLMALGLAACGERGHRSDEAASAAPMSETVSDVPASSEEPAAAAAVPASQANARVPAASGVATDPGAQTNLNDDEVAAAGDTRRRPAPAPSDTPQ